MLNARQEARLQQHDEVLAAEVSGGGGQFASISSAFTAIGGGTSRTPLHRSAVNRKLSNEASIVPMNSTGGGPATSAHAAAANKIRNLSSATHGGYSPPGENLLPRNHVIGSRARYEMQMLDSTLYNRREQKPSAGKEDSSSNLFQTLFRRARRPSDKHKEFVDMLQFPKGNK